MPRISVVIPAYNAERFIEKCLLSLREQTFRDFETIVVDDGSADRTAEIAERHARLVKAPRNLGVGGARNLGAEHAQGGILAFTDADVVLTPEWLAKIADAMDRRQVVCVGGGYRGSMGDTFLERFAHLELVDRRKDSPQFVTTLVANNFACTRAVFRECGPFPEKYTCEDLRLSYRISLKHRIYWDEENGVYHHFRPDLKGYLRQQYHFAQDTVWCYWRYPGLALRSTHQGKGIYREVAWTGLALAFAAVFWRQAHWLVIAWILGVALMDASLLSLLKRERLPVLKSLAVILARDFVCVFGIFSGIGRCIADGLARLTGLKREEPGKLP